jgi:hypothetical protein
MTSRFPPVSTRIEEIGELLGLLAAVIDGRTAIYVSTPLTTGIRHSEWTWRSGIKSSHPEYLDELREHVVEPNRLDARRFAAELRRTKRQVVIDPGALADLADWVQDDYLDFWGQVIERYAATVIFRDGWEHSKGCSYEFLVALDTGAETLDADLKPLSAQEGLSLLRGAIEERRERGVPEVFLSQVAGALRHHQRTRVPHR